MTLTGTIFEIILILDKK